MASPSLFIGSSTEALDVARAIKFQLKEEAEVTIWNEGLFGLGKSALESLVQSLEKFDFAILVLSADDLVLSRNSLSFSSRDNVGFELGLFTGHLKQARTFIICEGKKSLKIPSDLAGITIATYDAERSDKNLIAAVGDACFQIRQRIRELGAKPASRPNLKQSPDRSEFFIGSHGTITDSKSKDELPVEALNNPVLRRFINRMNDMIYLHKRCETAVDLKRSVADFFWSRFFDKMISSNINKVFFEAGSSIAYVTEVLVHQFMPPFFDQDRFTNLHFHTNNILTYIDFLLFSESRIDLFPVGSIDIRYGATFGEISTFSSLPPPAFPRILSRPERMIMEKYSLWFRKHYLEDGIILMTTSYVEVNKEGGFAGPHVGSSTNMIFKRSLLESAVPAVIFLDERKIPVSSVVGHCYSICDKEFTWSNLCKTQPIAIAVACRSENKMNEVERILLDFGLEHTIKDQQNDIWTGIAFNNVFNNRINR